MIPGLAITGVIGLAGVAVALVLLQGRTAPLAAPAPLTMQVTHEAPAAPVAAHGATHGAAQPSVQRVDGKLALRWVDAERREAIERLAAVTGSRLFGAEGLPPSLGRVSLKAAGIDVATAWHLLLDNAPVSFALACDGAACEVWFASAGPSVANAAPVAPVGGRVESTEGEN